MTTPWGFHESPTCDHPRTVDERTWSDPGPVIVCLDCGHTINADRPPTHPPKPPRIQTRKVNGL